MREVEFFFAKLRERLACETGEGELWDLDPDPALEPVEDLDGLDVVADDDVGRRRDEVEAERLEVGFLNILCLFHTTFTG